jgi:hypothetical protein
MESVKGNFVLFKNHIIVLAEEGKKAAPETFVLTTFLQMTFV